MRAEKRQTVRALSDRAWRASLAWACEVAEGMPGADGMPPTNMDRLGVAHFLAKLRGEYAPTKVAVKAGGMETRVCVAFADMGGRVEGEDDAPALPKVVAPDAVLGDDARGV